MSLSSLSLFPCYVYMQCVQKRVTDLSSDCVPKPGASRGGGAKLPVQSPARRAVAGREAVWLARALPCLRPYFKETGQRLPLSVCFPRPRFHPPPSLPTGGGESEGEGGTESGLCLFFLPRTKNPNHSELFARTSPAYGRVVRVFALGFWTG